MPISTPQHTNDISRTNLNHKPLDDSVEDNAIVVAVLRVGLREEEGGGRKEADSSRERVGVTEHIHKYSSIVVTYGKVFDGLWALRRKQFDDDIPNGGAEYGLLCR